MEIRKTLYVTDLDGTLLTDDKRISDFTKGVLAELISKGALITYATARSYVSASAVIEGFEPKIPSIIYNGTFLRNNSTGEQILLDSFDKSESEYILSVLESGGVYPLVYAYIDGKEKYSYDLELLSDGTRDFVIEHEGDVRDNPSSKEKLGKGEVFHFVCIDEKEAIEPFYNALKDMSECVLYKEQYSGKWWLEIHPLGATKASAILKLKDMLGAHRVVCFGDGPNDASMFLIADEGYATENAEEALKAIATGIIESNENDGVAKWLLKNLNIGE